MLNSNEVLNGTFAASRRYSSSHNGIDLKSPNGTIVKSRYAGVVKVTGTNPPGQDFGNYIRIFHPQLNQSTWYAHLQSFSVKVGQQVSQGQQIGLSNNTGLSTGPHLHFGQSRGETTQWLDPDTQPEGGEIMVTKQMLDFFFTDLLGRLPDPGAYTTYLNKPVEGVYNAIRSSAERSVYQSQFVTRQQYADDLAKLQKLYDERVADIKQLQATIKDNHKALEALVEDNNNLSKEVADLTKKVAYYEADKPTPPSIEDALKLIVNWFKKVIGGEK